MDDVLDISDAINVSPIAPEASNVTQAPAPLNGHSQANESFELHSASFEGSAHAPHFTRAHLQRHSTTRRHHNKYRRVVKSQSEHGHLLAAPRALSVASYGLGSVSSSRVLSPDELEFLRRSQIFNLLRGQ